MPRGPWQPQSGAVVGRASGLELGVEEMWAGVGATSQESEPPVGERGIECLFDTGYLHASDRGEVIVLQLSEPCVSGQGGSGRCDKLGLKTCALRRQRQVEL